ncbi:Uncharacterised protein [Mycobacteroides abscessus subsp. abscessus]|nr:Uncharacterised protein [Mycobacteroides abscessus subsp. abscessus]
MPMPSVTTIAKPRANNVATNPSSMLNMRSIPCEKWMPWSKRRDGAHCSPIPYGSVAYASSGLGPRPVHGTDGSI